MFDQNVYKDASGKVLDKAPSTVGSGGRVADKTVVKDVNELESLYLNYLGSITP